MRRIELITKRVILDGKIPTAREFYLQKDQSILIFADRINQTLINYIIQFLNLDLEVVLITLDKTDLSLPYLHIISVNINWYIHTLFLDPLFFNFVFGFGAKAQRLALAYSQFTQYTIENIYSIEQLKDILSKVDNKILIQSFNGIGDALMALPAIKDLAKEYKIDVSVFPDRKQVFYNLPYINSVNSKRRGINLSYYKKFYDITNKFCDYSKEINRQHRVDIIAKLVGAVNYSYDIDINLTNEEIEKAKIFLEGLNNRKLICFFESNESVRSLPTDYVNSLLPKIKGFDIILVARHSKEYKTGLNLTGKLDIRTVFALTYLSDVVLTVDTSGLHIAHAFNKPTILLPGIIDYRWRIYKNVFVIKPDIFCYPCNRMKPPKSPCLLGKTCLSYIPQDKILEKLSKI